ncbi:copper chaperone [Pseudoalteromonas sp. MSK9-3]|uniref:copper chaperone PCu(A)C n=1 Tax=Pseudoalteromonas sp. MSK9-3 TaxID=1897633 RepID=UPI000E6D3D34|nr:copper chaperone PCu(A)C [Pseudoalteromonas sp. MSK9-3]RJE75690.1 copper chaperone [Pseudoalteromonas sp. MSK9-3]
MFAKFMALASGLAVSTFALSHQHNEHSTHESSGQVQNEAHIVITDAKVRAFLPASRSTAAYFTLNNRSHNDLELVKATIKGLGRVEIHEHVHHNGMMKMQQVNKLTVAANEQVKFQPGGYHLMAFEPEYALKAGEKRKLTLHFANGSHVFTMIDVVSLKDSFKKVEKAHHHHED